MAVITRYIIVRNGVELDLVFDVKKDADAYDKMLDAAEELTQFIKTSDLQVDIDDKTLEDITVFLAKNGATVSQILKGIKPAPSSDKAQAKDSGDKKETKAAAPGKTKPSKDK